MALFFRFEAVFMPETASEKEQLWQLGEARVFDQMTSDQASGSLKHEYYHLQDLRDDPFQMTRPIRYMPEYYLLQTFGISVPIDIGEFSTTQS